MIGTNHSVEAGFMDKLPFTHRDAALDLLKFSRLKQLVDMRLTQPSQFLQDRFSLTPEHWNEVLNAVILTKLSYFTISPSYPNAYINKLLEIAAYALSLPGGSIGEMFSITEKEYPFFARWLKSAHDVKLLKYRLSQKQQTSTGSKTN